MKMKLRVLSFSLTLFLIFYALLDAQAVDGVLKSSRLHLPIDFDYTFSISFDGKQIAYWDTYSLPEHLRPSIPIYTPDGKKTGNMRLGHNEDRLSMLSFRSFFHSDSPAEPAILLQEPVELITDYQGLEWSPDGEWLAFYRWQREFYAEGALKENIKHMGVCVIPTTGGEICFLAPANIISGKGNTRVFRGGGLSWSPDGNEIAFVSWQDDHSDIYIVSRDSKQLRPFTVDHKDNEAPSWSPDGKKIAFRSRRGALIGHEYRIWVKPVDGGEPVLLSKHVFATPIWSPDGKMIAYFGRTPQSKKEGFIVSTVNDRGMISGLSVLLRESGSVSSIYRWTVDGKIIFLQGSIKANKLEKAFWMIDVSSLFRH